jgi:hypothetical protein
MNCQLTLVRQHTISDRLAVGSVTQDLVDLLFFAESLAFTEQVGNITISGAIRLTFAVEPRDIRLTYPISLEIDGYHDIVTFNPPVTMYDYNVDWQSIVNTHLPIINIDNNLFNIRISDGEFRTFAQNYCGGISCQVSSDYVLRGESPIALTSSQFHVLAKQFAINLDTTSA